MKLRFFSFIIISLVFLFFSFDTLLAKPNLCKQQAQDKGEKNYTPQFAQGFTLVWQDERYLALLKDVKTHKVTDVYVINNCNEKKNENLKIYGHIPQYVPRHINKIFSFTLAVTYELEELQSLHKIIGITQARYFYHPIIRKNLRLGKIKNINNIEENRESILLLHPDLVISGDMSMSQTTNHFLQKHGCFVLIHKAHYEKQILGSTEWILLLGAVLHKQEKAKQLFRRVSQKYLLLAKKLAHVKSRPIVLSGDSYQGIWYVSGSSGYFSKLIHDAGGTYLWQEYKPLLVRLSWEKVLIKAKKADIWINPGGYRSLDEIKQADRRYLFLSVFQKKQVYNNILRKKPSGANSYWSEILVKPQILLADIAWILHPLQMPKYQPRWFKKLT